MKKMLHSFLLLFFLFPSCISLGTITTNQPIKGSNILLSRENTFALGFFSPGISIYKYVGIWYHKLPQKTVVWVANRDNPIPSNDSSAVFTLSRDGRNLVLYSGQRQNVTIWSTNVSSLSGTVAGEAQLLDSGNLILLHSETKQVIWQSFDYPTDTMLPGMKLGLGKKENLNWFLSSWRSENDPSVGEFSFKIKTTSAPQFFLFKGLIPYWRSSPWPRSKPPNIPESLYKYNFVNTEDEVYYTYLADDKSVITRSVVDNSGSIQRLTWYNSSQDWKQSWYAPRYIYGYCGANSIIDSNNANTFECSCLPGYEPKFPKNWFLRDGSGGCVRKQDQIKTSMCRNGEGFVKLELVKVPDTSVETFMNSSMSTAECQQVCLMNCSCKAFAIIDGELKGFGCLMWYGELMDTIKQTDEYDLYVRVDATELAENARKRRNFLKKKGILTISVLSAAVTMIFLIIILAHLWCKKKRTQVKKKGINERLSKFIANELVENKQAVDLPIFDLGTVSVATENFNPANKLGQGGFGAVYKGELVDGQEIAVKRLSKSSCQGIDELKNEVMLIARLQHRNLVKLLGCCIEGDEQMLIYEFMPNKSLDFFIFDEKRRAVLDWTKRFDIIVGIARGTLYLHHDSRLRIIHRDLKLSNVLLDGEMNPKISDFGMARIFKGDDGVQNLTNRVVGTYGYMAPEYANFGKFSTKSDVFSFGVILLEIISGKKSNNSYDEDPSLNLIGHVWELWREEKAVDIMDSFLKGHLLVRVEVVRCIQIGLLCVEEDANDRPSMASVVVMLNSEATLPLPKQPAFVFRKTSNHPPTPSMSPVATVGSVNELTISLVECR